MMAAQDVSRQGDPPAVRRRPLTVVQRERLRFFEASLVGGAVIDLLDILVGWADVVREVIAAPNGLEAMALVLRYIALVNDHVDAQKLQAFLDRVATPDAKDALMTYGERLIQQGFERGEQEGFQKGEQEGFQRGERALLLRQLWARFGGQVDAAVERRVEAAPAEQIALWGERVLTAASLSDLLAD